MEFALSTHWNAARHARGETLVEEILQLGFKRLELGYDLRMELVPGVQAMVRSGAARVDSVHNFCPVPLGAARGHPELWTLSARDERERERAIQQTAQTIRFAAEIGARVVVTHAGNVEMKFFSAQLFDLALAGQQFSPAFERARQKMQDQRDRKAPRQFDLLLKSLERLLPVLEETGVLLAIENLPTWESLPTEIELEQVFSRFGDRHLRYWHDMGHGQIRQNMGLINHERWLERLAPHLAGMHVHDVRPPATDHVMPPRGQIDFSRFHRFAVSAMVRVVEPSSRTPASEVSEGLAFLKTAWTDSEQGRREEHR